MPENMDPPAASLISWHARRPTRRKYLVGVSGGVDSVVLLHSLLAAGYRNLVVCHLDHGLRGKTSAADARWVSRLASRLGIPAVVEKSDVARLAADSGQSMETAGRAARHRFFAENARRFRATSIWLGHHADDQVETVLMNLCRGSAGLSGMKAETSLRVPGFRTALTVLRPFLSLPKSELAATAAARRWTFRPDASNAIPDVVRNRLRLEVLPLLDEIFQRPVAPAIGRAAAWTAAAREFLASAAEQWTVQEKLPVAALGGQPAVLRDTILAGWLRACGVPDVSSAVISRAAALLDPVTGPPRWNLPGNLFLRRRAGWIWVERVPPCGAEPD